MTTAPWGTVNARLGWVLESEFIHGEGPEPAPKSQCLSLRPALEGGFPLADDSKDVVLDPYSLLDSACRPGGYFLLTCSCGSADDAGIGAPIFVSHPDPDTIMWELDLPGLKPCWGGEDWMAEQDGFLRLVFERGEYEADLRRMVADIQAAHAELELEELVPGDWGKAERLLARSLDESFRRSPVLPPGSELAFGILEKQLFLVDGNPFAEWPPRLFPSWSVFKAFNCWKAHEAGALAVASRWNSTGPYAVIQPPEAWMEARRDPNQYFLLIKTGDKVCDADGAALLEALEGAFAKGGAAPGVSLRYQPLSGPPIVSSIPDRDGAFPRTPEDASRLADIRRAFRASQTPLPKDGPDAGPRWLQLDGRRREKQVAPGDAVRDYLLALADLLKDEPTGLAAPALTGDCAGLIIEGDVVLLSRDLPAVDCRESVFRGRLVFEQGHFRGLADFRRTLFMGEADFDNVVFEAGSDFRDTSFLGRAGFFCTYGGDGTTINFNRAIFIGFADFEGHISRHFTFEDAKFLGATDFDG